MTNTHKGRHSVLFSPPPHVSAGAAVVGKKEAQGPLGRCFDVRAEDTKFGKSSWEQAESAMQTQTLNTLLKKAGLTQDRVGAVFSGDLLNQCIGSSFPLRNRGIPALGLYGACSTMAEALLLAGAAVSGGFLDRAVAMTSSHFAAAERQYRFPLGYGGQRTPTSQWTVTGCGAALVTRQGSGPLLTAATVGTVVDGGVKDANNMGAAMAPAACETIKTHFDDMGRGPEDYDLILTGDLGSLGSSLLLELLEREGIRLRERHRDCGVMIFDAGRQDTHCGGSGCGCSAAVLCGHILDRLARGELHRVLFCGTGALLSPLSTQQGQSIPGVCHAVILEGGEGWTI